MSGKVLGMSDAAVMRASHDDPDQFTIIFERHHRVVWTYIARVAGRDAADELTGEVFCTAFARRSTYDPDRGAVRSWLYGIASHLLQMRFRSAKRASYAHQRLFGQRSSAVDDYEIVDDADELRRAVDGVLDAMEQLSIAERELIVLYAWERLSYADIAAVLELPVGTVRSRLSRARRRLRELVEPNGQLFDISRRHATRTKEIS